MAQGMIRAVMLAHLSVVLSATEVAAYMRPSLCSNNVFKPAAYMRPSLCSNKGKGKVVPVLN
jgi:hypothetical protein